VLGLFLGTLTFSFALLRNVEDDAVPNLGITLAGLLVLSPRPTRPPRPARRPRGLPRW
jgi:hypothetical protein